MIKIKYKGRFGNNMFQYTFAKLLSEKYNNKLITDFKHNIIKSTYNLKQDYLINQLLSNQTLINDNFDFNNFDKNKNYIVDGFFQNINYYINDRNLIKSFFDYDKSKININKKDIVLHIRLTDYYTHGYVIHPSFYLDILKNEEYDNIYIISDGKKTDPYFNYFKKYKYTNISSNMRNDFYKLMEFDKVILSNSSFSWWSMFLGNSSRIYTFKKWIRKEKRENDHLKKLYNLPNSIVKDYGFLK